MVKKDTYYQYDRRIQMFWNIKNPQKTSLFVIQDGDQFKEEHFKRVVELLDNTCFVFIDPIDRLAEYTPWPSESLVEEIDQFEGCGEKYLEYIFEKLIPEIERKIKLGFKIGNIYFAGASLGGLISNFALLKESDLLGGGVFISASYWYANFFETLKKELPELKEKIIYMDIGLKEQPGKITQNKDIIEMTNSIVNLYLNNGISRDNFQFIEHEDMDHREIHFPDRILDGIEFILKQKSKRLC